MKSEHDRCDGVPLKIAHPIRTVMYFFFKFLTILTERPKQIDKKDF